MPKSNKAYLAVTALFCLAILPGAVMDIVQPAVAVDMMTRLGLPASLLTLIGIWKLMGVVALALPRFRRINEWAYAGFVFDLTGAAWLHAAGSDTMASIITPLVFLVPLTASYLLRNKASEASVAARVAA